MIDYEICGDNFLNIILNNIFYYKNKINLSRTE